MIVVVGAGRVGSAFVRATPAIVVRRGEPIPDIGAPIVVATRADDLEAVLAAAPRRDLVFVQNGMILPFLREHGLERSTQGLIYFAATSREGPVEAGAPSLFWGPHAPRMVAILEGAGIPARVVPAWEEFAREIAIKLAWNVIFGLLGDTYDEPVGCSAAREDEVAALAAEIAPVLARGVGVDVPPALLTERLLAYSRAIPGFRAGVRELRWRNGWIAKAAKEHGIPTPRHAALLAALGHV